jgi:hypothetical protein
MNIIGYIIYLITTYLITVHVGLTLHKNGRLFILDELNNNEKLTDFVNKILLLGYYLINLGYTAYMLSTWQHINNWVSLVSSICGMIGRIVLTLGVSHYLNICVIILLKNKKLSF